MRPIAPTPHDSRRQTEATAINWARRLDVADPAEEVLADFALWLLEHPANAGTWDRLERLESDLSRIAQRLADQADQ